MRVRRPIAFAVLAGLILTASPALAQDAYDLPPLYEYGEVGEDVDYEGDWQSVDAAQDAAAEAAYAANAAYGLPPQPGLQPGARPLGYSEQQREGLLAECRSRSRDNGLGGALIGGVLGGIAGNRIAGRGNRTVGTIAGAAIGAVAGAAIDKSEDRGRVADQCEGYLARYEAGYGNGGAPHGGYSYGHGPATAYGPAPVYGNGYGCTGGCDQPMAPVMWVPVMTVADCKPRKKQRVIITEEWIDEEVVTYEKVPSKVTRVKVVRVKTMPAKPTKLRPVK